MLSALLLLRRLVPGTLVQRAVLAWVRMEAACCRANTPQYRFMARYLDHFERAGTFERMRRFLRERPRARAAARLDAWVRMGVLGSIRHELLGRRLGAKGVPPRLLMEAQLALSPGCDLTCEGCYTAEDRGGAAPRRERIAYLVDEVVACGAFAVHVIGKGEPFLSPRWANELLDVIEDRPHVFFTIATHGMHIDDALAERMGRIGNLLLLVAIDGPEPMHDARRGPGSYQKVHAALERLRRHGALFGFSCMVSAKSYRELTEPELVEARAEAGCAIGVYSRYFPLASQGITELALGDTELRAYKDRFEAVRSAAGVLLLDLDEVEQHTGCHARAGETIYVDGITGQVSPCLRVPFAPDECRLDSNEAGRLAEILAHPYFVAYRGRSSTSCPTWCGANLDGEIASVGALLSEHASIPEGRLRSYEERARTAASPERRRLPIAPPEAHSS
jgi:uncharacterized Fe-S cluster-containing radical SAM superfamily protein